MPLSSMTGYADRGGSADGVAWSWEARSVNGRGLDLRLRLAEGFESLDPPLRQQASAALTRGTVTVTLRVGRANAAAVPRLRPEALEAAIAAALTAAEAAARAGLALTPVSAADLLGLRGVMEADALTPAETPGVLARVGADVGPLIAALIATRAAEGGALAVALEGQLGRIGALAAAARATAEARAARSGALLRSRLEALLATVAAVDEARLAQELALIAVKADVTEELDRLEAHVAAAGALIAQGGAVGRRLDFLMQELNREANTLCAKSGSSELTAIGLELKAVDRADARAGAECGIADDGQGGRPARHPDHPLVAVGGRQVHAVAPPARGRSRGPLLDLGDHAAAAPGEEEGRDYFFKSRREFEGMVEDGEMLEHAEVFGNLYGTPRAPVEAAIARGEDVLFDVDWQGGQQIRNSSLRDAVVSIFILPPSIAELEKRLKARGQDANEVVASRMAQSRDEISHWAEYDYVLINERLAQCEAELRAIIRAERLRRDRRPGLVALVRRLNGEFEGRLC